ncbi:class A beta-lactamase-related serine hydrolase [Mycobacterium sp. SMC-8]|uniref:class A beta-lactamase-related serine hydrolase n=1 Tax=Mycobacterium sp. SMC-8 TaxID=2857060 RepID=UPI0021B3905C|nr:class A beta-lactamase-related serine hydrolase [Mycobacterium sp. SMC-8]UXA10090.1 class A beta-lactamase-related serine hydrolase [Mycobacterium sp. SMC-8]
MRRPSRLFTTTAALTVAAATAAGCTATGNTSSPPPNSPHLTVVAPLGTMAPLPEAPPDEPPAAFSGLPDRAARATAQAADAGAEITTAVLDRNTGQLVTNGNDMTIAIASVAKLFIADDLLLQVANGDTELSPKDRASLDLMLRASDDSAAEVFWNRSGRSAIIDRVVKRYGLSATRRPGNGRWFNTTSTATDLVRYYDMLLSGAGGLPPEQVKIILSNLAASTPTAPDGMVPGGVYPQRFGIPEGLFAERVAVKQGWMCCVGADWMHLSTGVVGTDRRYIVVIGSMQPASDDVARQTITDAVKTMFPGGRI